MALRTDKHLRASLSASALYSAVNRRRLRSCAIVEALAGRHARDDVVHALMRLAVTGQLVETGGNYTLGVVPEP
jgi:hypothetical protein